MFVFHAICPKCVCIPISRIVHSGIVYFFSGKKVTAPPPLPPRPKEPVRLRLLMHQSIETTAPRSLGHSEECNICTVLHFKLFLAPRKKLNLAVTTPTLIVPVSGSLEDFPKLVSVINNRYGSLKGAIAAARFSYRCDC